MEFTLLLTASVFGVTLQQVARKAYHIRVAGGTFTFTAFSILFALGVFLMAAGGKFEYDSDILPYCIGFALAYSASSIGAFLAIRTGPMSLTSLMIQYSLIIPTFYGILFLKEEISALFYPGIGLLLVSLFLVNCEEKGEKKISLKWILFMLIAFLGNGLCSTVQKAQQNAFITEANPDGYKNEFMIIALAISAVVIFAMAFVWEKRSIGKKITTGAYWYIICGLANGLVNLFVLILAKYPASIVFPVISAGGILASTLVGIFVYKERLSVMQIAGMSLGTASIILLNI